MMPTRRGGGASQPCFSLVAILGSLHGAVGFSRPPSAQMPSSDKMEICLICLLYLHLLARCSVNASCSYVGELPVFVQPSLSFSYCLFLEQLTLLGLTTTTTKRIAQNASLHPYTLFRLFACGGGI